MSTPHHWSRMPGFFCLDPQKRREVLSDLPLGIEFEQFAQLDNGLALELADAMSENVFATFGLPFSCAANFVVDQSPVVVPMVTEEPSIVAACSKMAKLVAENGGFLTDIEPSLIKGHIQIFAVRDVDKAREDFLKHKPQLLSKARLLSANLEARGGGVRDLEMRVLTSKIGPMVLIEPLVDVVDAMGANLVNTILEGLAEETAAIFDGTVGIKILSNLCDQRRATAKAVLRFDQIATDNTHDNGALIAAKINAAHAFAEADIYRACTHNKGILNGIDAVAIATGNDFRAIEAGAHAYASVSGGYGPLTSLVVDEKARLIHAQLTLPLAVGVVGGLAQMHPGVVMAHRLLGQFAKSSRALSSVMVSVGLSQCLAALLALCQDGIQKGHMKLHRKKLSCGAAAHAN